MRDGLAPFLGQRQRFAATIDRIGVKDGWQSAITVLLKDVALADTGDLVADHLWLRYGPWADELASGLQVGARINLRRCGNPLREGVHRRRPGATSRPAQGTGLRAGEDSNRPWPRPRWAWVNCPDFALSSLGAGGTAMPRKQLNIGLTPAQYEAVSIAAEAEGQKHCTADQRVKRLEQFT